MSVSGNYQLLHLKEAISENLSSEQIEKTLDQLLMNCLRPAITNTDYIEYMIVELLPYIFLNRRRKFSNQTYPNLRDGLFSFIMLEDPEDKITLLSKQGLERSVFFAALSIMEKACFLYLTETEEQLLNINEGRPYSKALLNKIKEPFYVKKDFYQTSQSITFWLKEVYRFRSMIVEKYTRHAYVEAKKMSEATNLKIDVEDLFRDLVLAIFKAIDKYDSKEGTLTGYINIWFMEAKTNYRNSHEYGVAFQMPTGQRKKLLGEGSIQSLTMELNDDIAESLEDQTQDTLQNLIGNENTKIMNNLACRNDKDKVYCLLNEFTYTLTPEDIEQQKESLKVPAE